MKQKLMEQEQRHRQALRDERARKGLLNAEDERQDAAAAVKAEQGVKQEQDAQPPPNAAGVDLSQFDDEDDDVAAAAAAAASAARTGESSSSDDSDSGDDSDEDAELARELDMIRREREQARVRAAEAEAEAAEAAAQAHLHILLPGASPRPPWARTRRSEASSDDGTTTSCTCATLRGAALHPAREPSVVDAASDAARCAVCPALSLRRFKNQAKGDLGHKNKKRFINDTIRSDFHRSFIKIDVSEGAQKTLAHASPQQAYTV